MKGDVLLRHCDRAHVSYHLVMESHDDHVLAASVNVSAYGAMYENVSGGMATWNAKNVCYVNHICVLHA